MNIRTFTLAVGIIFSLVGVLGFLPGLVTVPPSDAPAMSTQYGYLLGLFPVNWLHNIVHLAIGLWGLTAFKDFISSRVYARSLAVLYAALGVLGLIPSFNTVFGLIPIFGHDVWLHFLTALAAAYYGFMLPVNVDVNRQEHTDNFIR